MLVGTVTQVRIVKAGKDSIASKDSNASKDSMLINTVMQQC